jgi:DNA-binding LacI/PurR family transcriptional regulator
VQGVAIMTSSLTEEIAIPLANRDITVVMVDLKATQRYVSSLEIDYASGVSEVMEHLAQLGHEKVAFITGPDDRRSARRYREAVLKALHDRKLQLQQIVECDQTLEGGRAAVWKLSGNTPAPTALVCVNDMTAIGAMSALREIGLSVPGQVSIVGCEDIYMARFVNPPLTTVRFDRKALGRMAFDVLERTSRSKSRRGIKVSLPTQLIVRSSTAARNATPVIWRQE